MSYLESELLRELGISQKDVADALNVSPQRVSHGLREGSGYLNPARLQALYLYLANHEPGRAEEFRQRAIAVLPASAHEVLRMRATAVTGDPLIEQPITRKGTPRPWINAQEIWIFASRPKEIEQPDYLERMEREFFCRANPESRPITRMIYFVPPEAAGRLSRYLASSFRNINPNDRTTVLVIEAPAVSICPKFLIFDGMSADPTGFVACEGADTYARLSRRQVDLILDGLRGAGIGGKKDQILVPRLPDSGRAEEFKISFSSQDFQE